MPSVAGIFDIVVGEPRRCRLRSDASSIQFLPPSTFSLILFPPLIVGIYHFLGSLESYSCRADPRSNEKQHSQERWQKESAYKLGGADDVLRPWIRGFVEMVGAETARYLLEGAGDLTKCVSAPVQ